MLRVSTMTMSPYVNFRHFLSSDLPRHASGRWFSHKIRTSDVARSLFVRSCDARQKCLYKSCDMSTRKDLSTRTSLQHHPFPIVYMEEDQQPSNVSVMDMQVPNPRALENPLVWIDLETTGLHADRDTILEIACIVTDGTLEKIIEGPTSSFTRTNAYFLKWIIGV